MIAAVIFDLDGVLIDSETLWDQARERVTRAHGGGWHDHAQRDMMGMSSPEWSRYMHVELGVSLAPEVISAEVVAAMERLYRAKLPLLPGARESVVALATRFPLGLASSANRPLIDLALELAGIADRFRATVSSEEVVRGKPAPDVYLEAARRLGAEPSACVAIEDSASGLRAADAAGMRVIALPNPHFPPEQEVLALAATRLACLEQLVPAVVAPLARLGRPERVAASTAAQGSVALGQVALASLGGIAFGPLPGPGDSDGGAVE